jgi:glutamate synthase domain-containing protein 2
VTLIFGKEQDRMEPRHEMIETHFLLDLDTVKQIIYISLLIILIVSLIALYIYNRVQKRHAILRNYPVVGYFRFFFEWLGIYLRQFFYSRDWEELPFNRAERSWIYRAAKNIDTTIGFGTTRDMKSVGTIFFVDAPFPVMWEDAVACKKVVIGPYCRQPYECDSIFNIGAMSYGAMSKEAIRALGQGAKMAGCWLNTGEGGVTSYHLESDCDLVAQIGTAKYGFRDEKGYLDESRLKKIADHPQIKMFEVKLSQGAKPGKGGILLGIKVTPEVAEIRGIPPGKDSVSPNRHVDIANSSELLDFIHRVREITGKPTGFKVVLGSYEWLHDFFTEVIRRGLENAPDFISLDGGEGGTGAAPQSLADYMGLPITESLPVLIDMLVEYGLKERIKVFPAGKLVTPAEVAWAMCVGADLVTSARGFMFALGCIQALRCHDNTCPTGITTQDPRFRRGLVVEDKSVRVSNYARSIVHEVGVISHSCGVRSPQELRRHHARIVRDTGLSISLATLYPEKKAGVRIQQILGT